MNIDQALNDKRLFAEAFKGKTWEPWRTFLRALFALAMSDADIERYHKHTGRVNPPTKQFREAALVIGRRGGKSRILALIAIYLACFLDYSEYLAPGEMPTIAIIAADRKQCRVILRYVSGLMKSIPLLANEIEAEFAESVVLKNGVTIEVHTGSISSPRGRTFIAVLADEIAFWRSDDSVNPDVEVITAVRPGLITIPTAMLLMASSPYAKRGVLWRTYRENYGEDDAPVLVWQAATREMNELVDQRLIDEAAEADPESAQSEYYAQFRSDIAGYIDRAVLDELVIPGRYELPRIAGSFYIAFCDPSGGHRDSFTIAIAHAEGDVGVLDCVREVRPPFSPAAIVGEFAELLRQYAIYEVNGDRYGGEFVAERFREKGIAYVPSDRPKSEIYQELLPLINSKKLELLDNKRLVTQLCSLERRTARGGRSSVDHPPGLHDDVANAAAGALVLAAGKMSILEIWKRL